MIDDAAWEKANRELDEAFNKLNPPMIGADRDAIYGGGRPSPLEEFLGAAAKHDAARKQAAKEAIEKERREAEKEQERKWQRVFAEHLTDAHMEKRLAPRRPFDPVWDDPRSA